MASPPTPQSQFSPDGLWWWSGSEWKPAISPDRLWRWNGAAWVPSAAPVAPPRRDPAVTAGIILGGVAVLVFVLFLVIVILLTMGNQISNVFDNVVTALGS
ncbi:MAG TPA: hypothetical protein VHQ03_07695 [Candidatus Dormibacteraeota bacterium]|nr:hypothetical protein [Candidatus Dormibacteraeota bacterium]